VQNNFQIHINKNLSFLKESKFLIAISGGIDSVVLTHLCKSLHLNFSLAHCNFNLRAEESNKDEVFVTNLAEALDVEVFIQHFDTKSYADENKRSIQMAARELRYDWFRELAQQLKFDYILTAHHADDNLETFLINFTRGTGLNGLTGIPIKNDNVVRPLLPFSRVQIEDYATKESIIWREDASNASRKYLRNKLRHEIVPILKEINPQLLESFQSTTSYLNDTADIVEESLRAVKKRAIVNSDKIGVTYKVSEFKKVKNSKAYLFEMFKEYGFTQWDDIVDLLDAESGKQIRSNTHRLVKHREFLILADLPKLDQENDSIFINETDLDIEIPIGQFTLTSEETISETSKNVIYIDKDTLEFPLELRLWKEGDFFYPSGMTGKKKVSKYLKDEKLSLIEKENIWLLTSNDKVVWIVGMRNDERFKVTETTKSILKIEYK